MDLPDCPPGAEGYQDSVTEVPKKPEVEESSCTKAEVEFQEHLNSLKIRLEDGELRCMVERRGRDISGKWIYLCYPCAAVCSGESILQTHISGKKHKIKLAMRSIWPKSIFDDHPFNQTSSKTVATERVLQKMAEEVDHHNRNPSDLDKKYNKYRTVNCHIQDSLDAVKAPLIGVEYLIEHPPEQTHYEPTYMCTLCTKQGHPRTIINHMTCFWHRYNYLVRHFPLACGLLTPYRAQPKYREGVGVIMNRLSQRIEDKYGRKRPVNIDKEEYEKDKVQIHEWVFRSHHFSEKDGATFTEVVDVGLIDSLLKSNEECKAKTMSKDRREPSPPIVAAPSRPLFNNFSDPEDVVEQADLAASTPEAAGKRIRKRGRRTRRLPKHMRLNPLAATLPGPSITVTAVNNAPKSSVLSKSVEESPSVSKKSAGDTVAAKLNPSCSSGALSSPAGSPPPAMLGPSATVSSDEAPLPPIYSESIADDPEDVVEQADLAASTPEAAGKRIRKRGRRTRPRRLPKHLRLNPLAATLPGPSITVTAVNNAPKSSVLSKSVEESPSVSKKSAGDTVAAKLNPSCSSGALAPAGPAPPAMLGPSATVSSDEAPLPPIYSESIADRPAGRQERRAGSVESLSDISDEVDPEHRRDPAKDKRLSRDRHDSLSKGRFEPYDKRRGSSPFRNRHVPRAPRTVSQEKQQRPPNYEYKVKLAEEKRLSAEDSLKKTLAYHEKNPEKHPLYPEEWKKFWNKRYKEIQAEGKDPSKHDFKPEWIVFWTARMKELHEEELRIQVNEIYRRMCLSPPDMSKRSSEPRRSAEKSRASEMRRKSPELRRKSPELRRRSPDLRRRSPDRRRPDRFDRFDRSDHRPREPFPRRRSPPDFRRDRRSPPGARRRSPPPHHKRTRSRSPLHRRSPARTHIALESIRRCSRSPLSQREQQRNRSPDHASRQVAPSMQTVLISDDELKPDDGLSPWNSDNDIESVGSVPESRTDRSQAGSMVSRGSKIRRRRSMSGGHGAGQVVDGAADDVVATLRQLVALEDYLGSLGPKIVDLLGDALKMEKEKANSSEELLVRESAVVLIETAKEKLKGAVQAGLVGPGAAHALRAAVVRAAATLHEADKRTRLKLKQAAANPSKTTAVPVAGVGEVDRAQIAQQMAEALIAQGKTDVSSEDLAVLVDAVVGMAEAKKRAAEQTKKVVVPPPVEKPVIKPSPPKPSGTASALQMLQSAYDENDKKATGQPQCNAPDAMDGLSDSDLETLLKNFNELSAEEQHSLIAYLKKLEAKEPERVERLRQYVSEAASTAPKEPTPEITEPEEEPVKSVVIESDDDDYTVEEVFQSATQKVKEDQIRQEMEIVKKSLEETKAETILEPAKLENSLADITKSLSTSSATDLFALVQASIKSTSAATPAPLSRSPNVVISNTQPRSFGDLPEPTVTHELLKPLLSAPVTPAPLINSHNNQAQGSGSGLTPFQSLQGLLRTPVRFQPPQQQQQQHQQHPQQQQQQQNYQAPPQSQQNYQSPQQQQQNYQPSPQNQQQNYQPPQANQQQNYQPPQQNQQQSYQPPQQNQQQPPYNQGQQQNYQPTPQHQQHKQGPQHNQMLPSHQQRNQPPQKQQQYQPPQHQQQYQPPQHQQQQQHFNDNRNKPNDHFNQGQWNSRPMENRGPPIRGPTPDNFGPNAPYNQGPRNNFMNGRGQDNYDTRPQINQQFGNNNYDNNQSNFRGRGGGRGNFGGPNRGRGRGYY